MSKSDAKNAALSAPPPKGAAFSSRREAIRATRVPGETPDPTPVALPVGQQRPLNLREEMMRFIRTEVSKQAQKDDYETFEEFDDFSIDDEEPDLTSEYTVQLHDEPGGYLLDPAPDATVQESTPDPEPEETPSLETRSEATGAVGAENTEPREVDKQSSQS